MANQTESDEVMQAEVDLFRELLQQWVNGMERGAAIPMRMLIEQTKKALAKAKGPLRKGGVLRCCALTLEESEVKGEEGKVLPCKYCKSSLIFRDGAWEWNHRQQQRRMSDE